MRNTKAEQDNTAPEILANAMRAAGKLEVFEEVMSMVTECGETKFPPEFIRLVAIGAAKNLAEFLQYKGKVDELEQFRGVIDEK